MKTDWPNREQVRRSRQAKGAKVAVAPAHGVIHRHPGRGLRHVGDVAAGIRNVLDLLRIEVRRNVRVFGLQQSALAGYLNGGGTCTKLQLHVCRSDLTQKDFDGLGRLLETGSRGRHYVAPGFEQGELVSPGRPCSRGPNFTGGITLQIDCSVTGGITGAVTDPTGSVIVGLGSEPKVFRATQAATPRPVRRSKSVCSIAFFSPVSFDLWDRCNREKNFHVET